MILKFNSYLFTCNIKSLGATYIVSTSKKNDTTTKQKQNTKQGANIIIIIIIKLEIKVIINK
jgi:hypothetical protein